MHSVALLIGGNQGDRRHLLHLATEQIRQRIGSVVALSKLYETEPWGTFAPLPSSPGEGREGTVGKFLNQALLVETPMTAHEVLEEALLIEALLGRLRPEAPTGRAIPTAVADLPPRLYHSRPIDIDIIFYDNDIIDTPDLTVPHPRMHLRLFVLEPLAEIMPHYRHPRLGKTVEELKNEVLRIKNEGLAI